MSLYCCNWALSSSRRAILRLSCSFCYTTASRSAVIIRSSWSCENVSWVWRTWIERNSNLSTVHKLEENYAFFTGAMFSYLVSQFCYTSWIQLAYVENVSGDSVQRSVSWTDLLQRFVGDSHRFSSPVFHALYLQNSCVVINSITKQHNFSLSLSALDKESKRCPPSQTGLFATGPAPMCRKWRCTYLWLEAFARFVWGCYVRHIEAANVLRNCVDVI